MDPLNGHLSLAIKDNRGLQVGTNSGTVEAHVHYHEAGKSFPLLPDAGLTKRLEATPDATILIPFPRDADFVERGAIVDHISKSCSRPGSRTALVGLGGVGKSQLAIEHAYRSREQSPDLWVFWIHASNAARFAQSYRDVANLVKIPRRLDAGADIFLLVHDWLLDSKNGPWLLILDNVDDAGFLKDDAAGDHGQERGVSERPLKSFIPQCQHGSVLVTSRSRIAAMALIEERDIIPVGPMTGEAATDLLKKKLEKLEEHYDDTSAAELAAKLEFIPLAIVQAAAYIARLWPRYSMSKYIEEFGRSDRKKSSLLSHGAGELRADYEAKHSIIITWQISFEHIQRMRPSAADLLSLMCFFDSQGISEALLRTRPAHSDGHETRAQDSDRDPGREHSSHAGEDGASEASEDDTFEEDVQMLRDFSFISLSRDATTFEMHKLVQLATRRWLEAEHQLEKWRQQFIESLEAEFPDGEYDSWKICAVYFPHVRLASLQRPNDTESLERWASLLYRGAVYSWQRTDSANALDMSLKSWKAREEILGPDNLKTLLSMGLVSTGYAMSRRFKEAERLLEKALEMFEKVEGQDGPNMRSSRSNLAVCYYEQGYLDKAEALQMQVVETSRLANGPEHPTTLTDTHTLASIYTGQERWKEAEMLLTPIVEIRRRILEPDHPYTLIATANLAKTWLSQGRYDEAEESLVKMAEGLTRVFGQEHNYTLSVVTSLGAAYYEQGRCDEAEELQRKVRETRRRMLGQEHPDTLVAMQRLALTHKKQRRWDDAEALEAQVLETTKGTLGEDNPTTAIAMARLGRTYEHQGRLGEAEELMAQAMPKIDKTERLRFITISRLAALYASRGRYEDAEELGKEGLETSRRVFGEDHPHTLAGANSIAPIWYDAGHTDEAIALMRDTRDRCSRVHGADHKDTKNSEFWLQKFLGRDGASSEPGTAE